MKFIDKKISDSFFKIYIILDIKEKKVLTNNIKQNLLEIKKEAMKGELSLYKSININSNSKQSKDKYETLKKQYENLSIENIKYSVDELEEGLSEIIFSDIYSHIESLKIIQIFVNEFSVIGSFDDNNPLTAIYSFCYVPYDYQLIHPKQKGNAYLFTNKDIDMIQTEMLITNKFYNKHKVLYSTEFSDLSFSYMCEDEIQLNISMDISEIENKLNIDRSKLIGLERTKYLLKNNEGQKYLIDIEDIYDKEVLELNDEIVKKINYLNTKNVKELRKKIDEVFSYIYNINSNVQSILQNFARINEFPIDDYVIKHYLKISGKLDDEITDQELEEMKYSFITSIIFAQNDINIEKYFFYIEQEYKMLYQIKKTKDNMSYDEYLNMKAPYYALYEFFRINNLVTERSYNE